LANGLCPLHYRFLLEHVVAHRGAMSS
jgi:hypothetical protein